jgi:AmiR/NasT family two-component response regulator
MTIQDMCARRVRVGPRAFDDRSSGLAAAFASYAAIALFNLRTYSSAKHEADGIRQAMQSRAVIEQAKGHLMTVHRCTAGEAFDLLIERSQRTNVKLRHVAHSCRAAAT